MCTPVPKCDRCGDPLIAGHYHDFDMPMCGGNPYPEAITVCEKEDCMSWAGSTSGYEWEQWKRDHCSKCNRTYEDCECPPRDW